MTATSFYMHLDVRGALHLGSPSRAKRPLKTIRNNHQLRG